MRTFRMQHGKSHLPAVLMILVLTGITYWPVRNFSFLNYDDQNYVTSNAVVGRGLTGEGVRWAFQTRMLSNWHPVTWISHMTDVELFGMDAGRHHLVNALLHAFNAVLLYFILAAMTQAPIKSLLVGLLFALHPLHVESAAWVSERKDLLSALFCYTSIGIYYLYTRRKSILLYTALLISFALGLMSKPMLVTLPILLLLIDIWPLKRWVPTWAGQEDVASPSTSTLSVLVLEKVPLLALSVASGIVTVLATQKGGAFISVQQLTLPERISNAVVSYVLYLEKTFFPRKLAAFYPHPLEGLSWWKIAVAAALFISICVAVLLLSRKRPYLATGWLWYVVTLLPVIGIVQVGGQAMADRYTYIPLTGIFIMICWGFDDLFRRIPGRSYVLPLSSIAVIVLCVLFSRQQLSYWKDTKTLFRRALAVTENNYFAHSVLGTALSSEGKHDEAMMHYEAAVRTGPFYAMGHYNYANSLSRIGRNREAIEHYNTALQLLPGDYRINHNLAVTLAGQGRLPEAIYYYRETIRFRPGYALAHANLGDAYYRSGDINAAARAYSEALRLNPNLSAAKIGMMQVRRRLMK